MSRAEQVVARLAELSGATATELRSALNEFDAKDIAAAIAAGAGGGGGLPTGWTQDASDPANVDSNGGTLEIGELVIAGGTFVGASSVDPSADSGIPGPLGSLYLRTNGQAWLKTGALDTDWTQFGGQPASAVITVRVPLAFDTPDLVVTGITAYTPSVGEILLLDTSLTITESWDGSSPGLSIYSAGDDPGDRLVNGAGLTASAADGMHRLKTRTLADLYSNLSGTQVARFTDTSPLKVMVDDGAAGDPESETGAGELILVIASA